MNSHRRYQFGSAVFFAIYFVFSLAAMAQDQAAGAGAHEKPQTTAEPLSPAESLSDDKWHIDIYSYLWFAGVHGTAGALGRNVSVHASAGDVLTHFNIGFMEAGEFRRNRIIVPFDFLWIKLSDDKAISQIPGTSVKAKLTETILTPQVGYVVVAREKLEVDAVAGLRYWHLGENLSYQPSNAINISESQNWVDALGGARIVAPLTPKIGVMILGNAGGGGADSDYQVVGALTYKWKPKWTLGRVGATLT